MWKDPNSAGTEADIAAQTQVVSGLRDELNTAAAAVGRIESARVQLEALARVTSDTAARRGAAEMNRKLIDLEMNLVDLRQTGTGQDANSISANPLFVNPNGTAATVDLHIMPGSPCIAAAIPISGIANDFDNQLRNPCTPDIGADELTPYTGPALANVSITKTADAPVAASGSQIGFTVRPVAVNELLLVSLTVNPT